MKPNDRLRVGVGVGASIFVIGLGSAAHAQTPPAEPYQLPPPAAIGQPDNPAPPPPGYTTQPGQPAYGYPPNPQPGYYQPLPQQPPRIVGYRTRPNVGLIVGGSVMLGSMWVITALTAGGLSAICNDNFSSSGSSGCSNTYWPLFIPVVGPFIQMNYVQNDSARSLSYFGLALDGLVQVSGLVMIIVGAAVRQRVPIYAQRSLLSPVLLNGGSGLAYTLRF